MVISVGFFADGQEAYLLERFRRGYHGTGRHFGKFIAKKGDLHVGNG